MLGNDLLCESLPLARPDPLRTSERYKSTRRFSYPSSCHLSSQISVAFPSPRAKSRVSKNIWLHLSLSTGTTLLARVALVGRENHHMKATLLNILALQEASTGTEALRRTAPPIVQSHLLQCICLFRPLSHLISPSLIGTRDHLLHL